MAVRKIAASIPPSVMKSTSSGILKFYYELSHRKITILITGGFGANHLFSQVLVSSYE